MLLQKLNLKLIGTFFAITLLIPPNVGINVAGINLEDIPLITIFLILFYLRIKNKIFDRFDKLFLVFLLTFMIYTTFITNELNIFNQTNLRFYFYFLLTYLIIDFKNSNEQDSNIIDLFEPLLLVMFVNFLIVIFQVQIGGEINGWILNNTASTNLFTSGRLGGLQGGGPNVIGIISAICSYLSFYKIINSGNYLSYIITNKANTFFLFISIFNLYFTYSRGSYLSLFVGIILLINLNEFLTKKRKFYINFSLITFSIIIISIFPSIFLKQSNRSFLNQLGFENTEIFRGVGGGNYVKNVYKDFLLTLDANELEDKFNISYSPSERNAHVSVEKMNNLNQSVSGFLKLNFDYRDGILPRSVVTFSFSDDELNWNQIGSSHTSGYLIKLFENDSFFEVGGWGDGQSLGGQHLSGYVEFVKIKTSGFESKYELTKQKKNIDFYVYTPKLRNDYEGDLDFKNEIIRLERPRDYWVAVPNETNLSNKDFEIVLKVEFDSIPKGHETLFSQSSIFRLNEDFNDQSWKWSIIDGRMYFFWIENVDFGYAHSLGGISLRSSKLIENNGMFDSVISGFSISQYDEITTSHNGFLTMSVEYGLFIVITIVLLTFYSIYKNFKIEYVFEIGLFLMLITQNLTNDLIYAPDVSIYFWIIPLLFYSNILRVKD